MSRKALEDTNYEMIKDHFLNPQESTLNKEQQVMIERIISAAKVLDKNPLQKQAVAIHQAKYPEISRSQVYEDIRLSVRLFNTLHTFEWDFWHTWLINDIVRNIEKCNNNDNVNAKKVIAMEHRNLLQAIGEKPKELDDPRRMEKNDYYILIQNNNNTIKIDLNNLGNLPEATLRELNKAIFAGNEISESEVKDIFKT